MTDGRTGRENRPPYCAQSANLSRMRFKAWQTVWSGEKRWAVPAAKHARGKFFRRNVISRNEISPLNVGRGLAPAEGFLYKERKSNVHVYFDLLIYFFPDRLFGGGSKPPPYIIIYKNLRGWSVDHPRGVNCFFVCKFSRYYLMEIMSA